jgi:hypothetical protein
MHTDKLMEQLFTGQFNDGDWLTHHLHVRPSSNCHLCKDRTNERFLESDLEEYPFSDEDTEGRYGQ